jgi:hypothetical protein
MMKALASAQWVDTRERRQSKPTRPSESTPPQMSTMPTQTKGRGASPSHQMAHRLVTSGASPRMRG